MLLRGCACDQTHHARAIEAGHTVGSDVGATSVTDRLTVEQHLERTFAGWRRLHDEVYFARHEWQHDVSGAFAQLDELAFALPAPFELEGAPLTAQRPDIALRGDSEVGRLFRLSKGLHLAADRRQRYARIGCNQQPPNFLFDLFVAALADPRLHESALRVEQVLRWPCVVVERAPDHVAAVDRNRIREPMVANAAIDV